MPEVVCDPGPGKESCVPESHAEWELPAEPTAVGTIRNGVREFARERGGTDALLIDLALAVTEAVTNSVVHAFIDREPGTVRTRIQAAPNELVVVVTDDGRGMQPRADSPGLGLGLPTIASLTTAMDMHAPPGGGTVVTMTFDAPGVKGPPRRAAREAELLDEVGRIVEGTWPGEGLERLVDLLVPELADACALDVLDAAGDPQRFAGRIDGPDGAAQSAWLVSLKPRTDNPRSAARQAMDDGGLHVVELTREHIARITNSAEDADNMAATGMHWWIVVPLAADGRRLGLLHFGLRPGRGEPPAPLLNFLRAVGDRASRALVTTQLISDLRRTRHRFESILEAMAEAVTVQDASGRMVYANTTAARLVGCTTVDELLSTPAAVLAGRFDMFHADGRVVEFADLPALRLLAGHDAPPLLTRSVHRASGRELWLLTKATLLDDGGELLAVNIIEDVTSSR
ncbi:ATP-binding protein [Solirubrobacter ginsenosidimutans]|uniref:ATP-binding protein n=1 Tax=Solirubrobacter ginsenosidimutans TaxID=490573 RepID=UPI0022CE1A92|nr:ATP-binding protein [Solirubrobacter ginsenosidimutans]